MSWVEERLKEMGEILPRPPAAVGSYVPTVRTGNLIVTSGQLPVLAREIIFRGKVGKDLHEVDGSHAARICTINALSQIKASIGDLDKITRIVRVEGFVNSADGFTNQPKVLNGASDFLVELFGEAGKHSRFAVGVNELPLDAAVEVALWVQVSDD